MVERNKFANEKKKIQFFSNQNNKNKRKINKIEKKK